MKKLLGLALLFLAPYVFATPEVVPVLPGNNGSISGIVNSTGVVQAVSISTSAVTTVTSSTTLPSYKLALTTIQNTSTTQKLYCGHSSSLTISGTTTGIEIGYGQIAYFAVNKEVPIYCIAEGSAALSVRVGWYGYK